MQRVTIGVDPHKRRRRSRSSTGRRRCWLRVGSAPTRPATPRCANASRRGRNARGRSEGSNGAGGSLAQRLVADGEHVVDVPAKLSARARLLDTGHGRKTDADDAHSVALPAVRAKQLRVLADDPDLEALRMLTDHRDELVQRRVQTVNRLQRLLAELTPGKTKKDITALQAKEILASVRPRDVVAKTRRRLAAEQLAELVAVEKKIKQLGKELKAMVVANGSTLMELPG